MDSLNNSLHELDNIPIEYAPKIKSKLEQLKPSHFYLCQDAHQECVTEECDFKLDDKETEEINSVDDSNLNEESSDKTENSDNLNVNLICEPPNIEEGQEKSCSNDYENFCILSFLRRKSN